MERKSRPCCESRGTHDSASAPCKSPSRFLQTSRTPATIKQKQDQKHQAKGKNERWNKIRKEEGNNNNKRSKRQEKGQREGVEKKQENEEMRNKQRGPSDSGLLQPQRLTSCRVRIRVRLGSSDLTLRGQGWPFHKEDKTKS